MTDTETDPDLAARLHAVARQVPAPHPDLDRVAAHADRRRRRRWATTGVAGTLVAAALAVGAISVAADDGEARFTTVGASIPGGPTTDPASSTPATTVGPTTSTTPPGSDTTTSTSTPTTSGPPSTAPATEDGPIFMVSEGDTVVWYLPSGTVSATPVPGTIVRAEPIGDGTAVAMTRGPDPRLYRLAPGEVLGEVEAARGLRVSDSWSAGMLDGRPVLVGDALDGATPGVIALDLDSGQQTDVLAPGPNEIVWNNDLTADGRVLITTGTTDEIGCVTVLVDLRTRQAAPTGVPGCAPHRRVAPDGSSVMQVGDDLQELERIDVATGADLGRWHQGGRLDGEGAAADFDGRYYVLTGAVDGSFRPDPLVLDIETGAIDGRPGEGTTALWIDPEPDG